jgi:hypothetical protein
MCSKIKYTTCYYNYIPKVLIIYYNFQNDIGITCFLLFALSVSQNRLILLTLHTLTKIITYVV